MRKFSFQWRLITTSLAAVFSATVLPRGNAQIDLGAQDSLFASCDVASYYNDFDTNDLSSWSREALQVLLEATHRQSLPYTDRDGDDVWKALQDVDAGPIATANGTADGTPTVRLIYSQNVVPAEPKGTPDTWNREHCWPKSRGVEESGDDFVDVHHLFPADWGVNSIRSNRFFNWCNITTGCTRLPDDELASPEVDTYYEDLYFQPPFMVRGDVARALFYMDVRYRHLHLTDCPDQNKDNEMAYLSSLLEWHALDPPSDDERDRNGRICSRWQGNRNPFVDFPGLASQIYGTPKTRPFQCGGATTDGENFEDSPSSSNTTASLQPGDVMVVAMQSDNPDKVALVALHDLSAGIKIHLSDNAWNGDSFFNNEGTISLTLPQDVDAGTVFGYGDDLLFGTRWNSENDAGFALAAAGDTIIVWYSLPNSNEEDTLEDAPYRFLSALSYSGPWQPNGLLQSEYETSTSALPDPVKAFSIALNHFDNYAYTGPTTGTKISLQRSLADSANWKGQNVIDSNSVSNLASQTFKILESTDTPSSTTPFHYAHTPWIIILSAPFLI